MCVYCARLWVCWFGLRDIYFYGYTGEKFNAWRLGLCKSLGSILKAWVGGTRDRYELICKLIEGRGNYCSKDKMIRKSL